MKITEGKMVVPGVASGYGSRCEFDDRRIEAVRDEITGYFYWTFVNPKGLVTKIRLSPGAMESVIGIHGVIMTAVEKDTK